MYTLNNGFNVFNNFFISNKFSLYSNFLNNNITQQSYFNNKRQYIQHLELFTNFTELSNKNSIKTDLFNSINFINFKYYTYNINTVFRVDNSKIKKLFFLNNIYMLIYVKNNFSPLNSYKMFLSNYVYTCFNLFLNFFVFYNYFFCRIYKFQCLTILIFLIFFLKINCIYLLNYKKH